VYLGGFPAGFSIQTRGAYVVGLCDVITEDGVVSPSKNSDIKVGDVILKIDNNPINNAFDIEKVVCDNKDFVVQIKRDGETQIKSIKPAKDVNGKYRLGVFIREGINGIGTLTYIKGRHFASLGHPVIDENGEIVEIFNGKLFDCNISGFIKGERGKAGELRGVFVRDNNTGIINKNYECGVFGEIGDRFDLSKLEKIKTGQARIGDAEIYTTINGKTPERYSISIVKCENAQMTKNFVIKVNDKRLLDTTGGIVQGMSGSPIIQNDKIVGAVTHVFINNPLRGYGIFIDNMLNVK
jgi:stage IV sporulation protein B